MTCIPKNPLTELILFLEYVLGSYCSNRIVFCRSKPFVTGVHDCFFSRSIYGMYGSPRTDIWEKGPRCSFTAPPMAYTVIQLVPLINRRVKWNEKTQEVWLTKLPMFWNSSQWVDSCQHPCEARCSTAQPWLLPDALLPNPLLSDILHPTLYCPMLYRPTLYCPILYTQPSTAQYSTPNPLLPNILHPTHLLPNILHPTLYCPILYTQPFGQ